MDAKGTIHGWVDADTKKQVTKLEFSPYGEVIRKTGDRNVPNFAFQGKYYGEEFKTCDFGFRSLFTDICRWPCTDPIGEAGGINLYGAFAGDPINNYEYLGCAWYNDWNDFKSANKKAWDNFSSAAMLLAFAHPTSRKALVRADATADWVTSDAYKYVIPSIGETVMNEKAGAAFAGTGLGIADFLLSDISV